jgi:Ca2+/Na+ antiporter
MIQDLLLDPSLLPVTIVFFVLVLFSYWQKLTRYVPYLAIVYLAFLLFTIFSYSDTTAYQQEDNNNIVEDSMELEVMMIEDSVVQSAGENIQASTGMEVKPFVAPKQPQDNKPKSIFVQRLVVCENIDLKQRKPLRIRDVFIDTTSKIYCFAGLRNPERSENITHVWKFNGEPYATVHMNVSVSDYFRCWSYITPRENSAGQWNIAVLDDERNVLKEVDFTIVPFNEP